MATLAEEFLNDLGEDVEDLQEQDDQPDELEAQMLLDVQASLTADTVHDFVRLYNSDKLNTILKKCDDICSRTADEIRENSEEENETVQEANEVAVAISNEIGNVHKFTRDKYAQKFPELEGLVFHPVDYAKVVSKVGNETDLTEVDLDAILPPQTVMTVSMTSSHSSGKLLPQEELKKVLDACEVTISLDGNRQTLLKYVESRMRFFAPNTTRVVGADIAAKLIGEAGGLSQLASMPGSFIQGLGKKKKDLSGFASQAFQKHVGYLGQCELVMGTPMDLRRKTARVISGKIALCARVDVNGTYPNGGQGEKFRDMIENKISMWQEPPKARTEKPLPLPYEKPKTRRGGRKARKMKQRYAQTELQQRMGRIKFGDVKGEENNEFKDFGMLGRSGGGLRVLANYEGKGFKAYTKKERKKYRAQQESGLATSIYAMTPIQGLELKTAVIETKKRKTLQVANAQVKNYFSGGFVKKKT